MKQIEILKNLKIHISGKQISNYRGAWYRLNNNIDCYCINNYLSKAKHELIKELNELIKDDNIDLESLKNIGLYETVRKDILHYKPSCSFFELHLIRNKEVKEKVIDNMLHAIILIDYSNYNMK